jgi:hypothetical protein
MLSRIRNLVRSVLWAVALVGLSGAPALWAQASDCPESAVGGQTGDPYTLQSQSLVTETTTVQLSTGGGSCLLGGSTTVTTEEQYNVGYYKNTNTGAVVKVDCRTGEVI